MCFVKKAKRPLQKCNSTVVCSLDILDILEGTPYPDSPIGHYAIYVKTRWDMPNAPICRLLPPHRVVLFWYGQTLA